MSNATTPAAPEQAAPAAADETPELYFLCKLRGLVRTEQDKVMTRAEARQLNHELDLRGPKRGTLEDVMWISARAYYH